MRHVLPLLLAPVLLTAAPPVPIEWETTPAAFAGRKAIVELNTGARIEGVWLGVTPTTFVIDVDRAHGKNRPPKGVQTIERSAIVELRVQQRQIGWRVFGTVFGWLAGSSAALGATNVPPAPILILTTVTIGHLVGMAFDKRSSRVLISEPARPQELPLEQEEAPEPQALPDPLAPEEAGEGVPGL